jgi:hypothetical protein
LVFGIPLVWAPLATLYYLARLPGREGGQTSKLELVVVFVLPRSSVVRTNEFSSYLMMGTPGYYRHRRAGAGAGAGAGTGAGTGAGAAAEAAEKEKKEEVLRAQRAACLRAARKAVMVMRGRNQQECAAGKRLEEDRASTNVPKGFEMTAHPVFSQSLTLAREIHLDNAVDELGDAGAAGCWDKGGAQVKTIPERWRCPVCLEAGQSFVTLTTCLHSYCFECIMQWFSHLHRLERDRLSEDEDQNVLLCPLCKEACTYFLRARASPPTAAVEVGSGGTIGDGAKGSSSFQLFAVGEQHASSSSIGAKLPSAVRLREAVVVQQLIRSEFEEERALLQKSKRRRRGL